MPLTAISDPPDGASASAEGTVRVVARLQTVARFVRQQQPEKDREGQDSSMPGAASGFAASAGRQRRPALLPKQSVAKAWKRCGH